MSPSNRQRRGFTLLEMAVTLAIVSILLGGLLLTLAAQQDVARERETRILMTQARDALYGFAMRSGRLPCPANVGTASTGVERPATASGCGGAGVHGVLPWATLGLPEGDDWSRRFTYSVTPEFARQVVSPAKSAFALTDIGSISVTRRGGALLINDAPAIIVSHGANGFGARNMGGSAVPNSPDADEQENSNGDFQFHDDLKSETYDDLVEWVVPSILMNRMVQAGRLP